MTSISVSQVAAWFDSFRQKCYIRGVLGKKNDRAADGRPYNMRKWTRWYVELRGPVLVFWNLLDANLAPYLDAITAMVDGQVAPDSPQFEETVATIKQVVTKPNFINITDASCSVIGTQKKRNGVWELLSSGANRFFMQATDDRAMNDWVLGIRIACFEAMKLYELYTIALIQERHNHVFSQTFAGATIPFDVEVRFSGSNDWVSCRLEYLQTQGRHTIRFCAASESDQKDSANAAKSSSGSSSMVLATMNVVRSIYSIYPDQLDLVDDAVIAKIEGDCDVDPSLLPALEDGSRWTRGSYALVIFRSPNDMIECIMQASDTFGLFGRPDDFYNDMLPDSDGHFLQLSNIGGKSVEIMEPVTARNMLNESARLLYVARTKQENSSVDGMGNAAQDDAADNGYSSDDVPLVNKAPLPPPSHGNGSPSNDARQFAKQKLQSDKESSTSSSSLRLAIPGLSGRKKHSEKHASGDDALSPRNRSRTVSSQATSNDGLNISGTDLSGSGKGERKFMPFSLKKKKRSDSKKSGQDDVKAPVKDTKPESKKSPTEGSTSKTSPAIEHIQKGVESISIGSDKVNTLPSQVSSQRGQAKISSTVNATTAEHERESVKPQMTTQQVQNVPPRRLDLSSDDSDGDEPLATRAQKFRNAGNTGSNGVSLRSGSGENTPRQNSAVTSMYNTSSSDAFNSMGRASIAANGDMYQNMMYQQQGFGQGQYATMPSGMGMNRPATQFFQYGMQPQHQQQFGQMAHQPMMGAPYQSMPQQQTLLGMADSYSYNGMNDYDSYGGPLLTLEKKADPIERPTGLVGAIASREQVRNDQKYRDSSSLMRDRQMRRQQQQMVGGSFMGAMPAMMRTGSSPHMMTYGQGHYDDAMSVASGTSNHFGGMPGAMMRNSMYMNNPNMMNDPTGRFSMVGQGFNRNSVMMNQMQANPMAFQQQQMMMNQMQGRQMSAYIPNSGMGIVGYGEDDDDVALSNFSGNRGSNGIDNHPLRAAMGSRMSASTPHLLGQVPRPGSAYGVGGMAAAPVQNAQANSYKLPTATSSGNLGSLNGFRNSLSFNSSPLGQNDIMASAAQSRHSIMSSGSGSGNSSNSSPLAVQAKPISSQSKWVKKAPTVADPGQYSANGGYDDGFGTKPSAKSYSKGREQAAAAAAPRSPLRSQAQVHATSNVYEIPGKPRVRNMATTRLASNQYLSDDGEQSDDDNPYGTDDDDSDASAKLEHEYPLSIPQAMAVQFELFLDHCTDVKPYTSTSHSKAYKAYTSFCSRNGVPDKSVALSKQFSKMMECADWKLDKSSKDDPKYKDICLT
ncbi:hypothetical protein H4219_001950 [Mycoemilia scoparia]|uniref:PH domain-containing protein n=1 Tax=Mycoemilia scoparia TaxID=417184 RepID=A0A9W7ZYW0_9FUNG|nr:hypothetical protein H4219_001950 [Mycoemilia scoparia]